MENINLSQANQARLTNRQSSSNPIETKKNTEQINDGNEKIKKGLTALAILGGAIVIGIAIRKGLGNKAVEKESEAINEIKTKLLKDIKFNKGIATLPDGSKFTGTIEDTLKNGDKITLEYTDGVIQKSRRSGSKTFEKIYETRFNGDKMVIVTENNATTKINLTEISNDVKKAQDDFRNLLENDDVSLWELKNYDRKYLSENQKAQLDDLLKKKTDELKAEELTKRQAQKATETSQEKTTQKITQDVPESRDYAVAPKYKQKISSVCSIEAENIEDFDNAKKNLENCRDIRLECIKKKGKYFDESELELIKEYDNKDLDDIAIIFDGKQGNPTDKLFLLARNNLQTKGTSLVIHEVPEIFSGLDPRAIEEAINELSCKYYSNTLKIADKTFGVEIIGGGTYNKVLRIFDDNNKSIALRIGHSQSRVRNTCEEIVTSLNLMNNNIADVPKFYMGNPLCKKTYTDGGTVFESGCWQLCEYVTDKTPIREGKKLFDYLKEINGKHLDLNSGAYVGDYIVDLGGI